MSAYTESFFDQRIDDLVDAGVVDNECVCDYEVKALGVCCSTGLTHPIPQDLSTSKLAFVSIDSMIVFNTDPQFRVSKAHEISGCWSKHCSISLSIHGERSSFHSSDLCGLCGMAEVPRSHIFKDLVYARGMNRAGYQAVPSVNDSITGNLDQSDGFGIPGFKANGGSCCDVETLSVCQFPVKIQVWIGLNEVVMRTNLG